MKSLCELCDSARLLYSVNGLEVCSSCVYDAVDVPEIVLMCGPEYADTFSREEIWECTQSH